MPENRNENMSFRKKGIICSPLNVFPINDTYILGVYQGSLSEHDILIKYRQRLPNGNLSRLRTPKHIHWAVDMLIKLHEDRNRTQEFIDFLLDMWNHTNPIRGDDERDETFAGLLEDVSNESNKYASLSEHGEYSVKFLLLLARLLMIQEKSNREDAYMFGNLLEKLKSGEDIFSIISAASYNGK